MLEIVSTLHTYWGYIATGISGLVGIWGVTMAKHQKPPRAFYWSVTVAIVALLLQIVLGVSIYAGGTDPGNQHVFYGVIIAVTFSLAYIYRVQFRKRPGLYLGLLLLFTMGLAVRGILTFGNSF